VTPFKHRFFYWREHSAHPTQVNAACTHTSWPTRRRATTPGLSAEIGKMDGTHGR